MSETLRVTVVNADFVRGHDQALINLACQDSDVVGGVEGTDITVADLTPPGWTAHQVTTDAGTRGSFALTRDAACAGTGLRLHPTSGPTRIPGRTMRKRWTLGLDIVTDAATLPLYVTHYPPPRNPGAREVHTRSLRALLPDTGPLLLVGDVNMAPTAAGRLLSLDATGREVMAYLSRGVTVTMHTPRRSPWTDHPILRAVVTVPTRPKPRPDPEVPVSDDRYELTTHDGKTVDRMTKQALEKAERRLGYPLSITQGSYNRGGVSASAGTHDGAGVVDLRAWDWERKIRVLREIGFAAWYRTPAQGNWPAHIHAVLIGNEKASSGALHQVAEYRAGRNGLAGRGRDDFWRPKTIKPYVYKPPPPPSNVSLLRKDIEQALAVYGPKIDPEDRPAAAAMIAAISEALERGPRA